MNFNLHLVQFFVLFTFILKAVYAGPRGHHNNRVGSGHRQSHRQPSLNRGGSRTHTSATTHSHGRTFGSNSNGHLSRHNSFTENISGSRSRHHHLKPQIGNRNSISSDLRHSSKSFNRVSKIKNHVVDSSVHHIDKSHRSKHISSNSINISPTVNAVSYNRPIIGGGIIPAGIGIPVNTVAVGLAPTIVNVQPGFGGFTGGYFNDPVPPNANYPYEYPVGVGHNDYPPIGHPVSVESPYLNAPPNLHRPRCYEEFRHITDDGKEIIILKFYSLDEFYLRDLRKYNTDFLFEDSDYPCDYYQPNIR